MKLIFSSLMCSMKGKDACVGECEWHGDVCEADATTAEGSVMERIMMISLGCSKKPRKECNGTCEWGAGKQECEIEELRGLTIVGGEDFKEKGLACRAYPQDKCSDIAGCGWQEDYGRCSINQMLVMTKAMGEQTGATTKGSVMERIMMMSLECSAKPRKDCNGTCEWGAGKKQECEIEELRALDVVGGEDFKQKSLACRAYPRAKCEDVSGCGWQEDYGRCSINQGLVMMKAMGGQAGAGALMQALASGSGRKLEDKAAVVAVARARGEHAVLRLAGLQPEQAYVAYCAAVDVPARQCRLGPTTKQCTDEPEHGRLVHFKDGHDLIAAKFTAPAEGGGGTLSLLLVAALVVAALAVGGFVLANWKKLSRRYWARRIVRPEDNELMACPVGPEGWAALRDA